MGAADAMKAPLGDVATPMQLLRVADPSIAAREALGDDAFVAAFDFGGRMTLDEVVAHLQVSERR
jgi:hypothetical protein